MKAEIDHLIVAAASLDAGAAWLEEKLGVPLTPGGKHAAMATHNRLLKLGQRLYLELIAIDADAPAPGRPRWFGLDDPALQARLVARPRLIHWVARCDEPPATAADEILEMARGGFRWRIAVPADGRLSGDGLIPSLIQWQAPLHPADNLPERDCALMKLEGFHGDPERIRNALGDLGLGGSLAVFPTAAGEAPGLVAYVRTPTGLIELD